MQGDGDETYLDGENNTGSGEVAGVSIWRCGFERETRRWRVERFARRRARSMVGKFGNGHDFFCWVSKEVMNFLEHINQTTANGAHLLTMWKGNGQPLCSYWFPTMARS